jgi:hypothetical protein
MKRHKCLKEGERASYETKLEREKRIPKLSEVKSLETDPGKVKAKWQ